MSAVASAAVARKGASAKAKPKSAAQTQRAPKTKAKQRASGAGAMQRVATPAVTLAPVIRAVGQRAATSRKHAPPATAVESAQAAAIQPKVEQTRGAAVQTVTVLDAAEVEKIKRNEFKTKLKEAIKAATPTPTTESQADSVMKTGAAKANETLRDNLATKQDAAVGPLKSAAESKVPASSQPAPPVASLQSEPVGAPPAPVSAAPVVPAPLPAERLDYSADRAPADKVMAENDVSKEQLQEGNDPAFGPTIEARSKAEKHEATAEAKYRQGESRVQNQAKVAATQALSNDLAGMHGAREQQIGKVVTQQLGTKAKDAKERQRITDTIDAIKLRTRMDVEITLSTMEKDAVDIFEDGLKRAEKAYLKTFNKAKGGVGTWLTTWGSDWEKLIKNSLAKARTAYLDEVDKAIDKVATFIDGKLNAAKRQVADGRNKVENFVKGLDESVRQFGEDALQAVSADFDEMDSGIDQRRDGLINKLTEQYKASYQRMSAMEEKLREANKSLWQRVYDATVGLVKKIIAFKNMLLGLLGKAVAIIGDIIAHPIRFLGNLVSGVMLGLKNFMSKIGTYLLKGIMDWLFGALSGAGLKLPDKFDLPGIISIVLQILGLTYANFRARAVAIVGEPVVATLEKTAEVFLIILKEGISGLWRFIQEQLTNLKSMVLDAIFDYIKEKVIIAGITWIIGLLNPASAFFKACKAIYDIVMFFVNRGRQIMALVNAVIDSLGAIAKGSIGVAAGFVENALAKAIPVAIGFLASLLGLGDPSKPVQGFIEKARAPVNKAIDWVINLVAKGVKTLFGKAKATAGKVLEWWKQKKPFKMASGESHEVYFVGDEKHVTPMVASKNPKAIAKKLDEFNKQASDANASDKEKSGKSLINSTKNAANKTPNDPNLVVHMKQLFDTYESGTTKKTSLTQKTGSLKGDTVGLEMKVDWLSAKSDLISKGSPADSSAQPKLMGSLVTEPLKGRPSEEKYIRGHLLNEHMGGAGKPINMFPITANANSQHLHSTEKTIKDWLKKPNLWVMYEVKVKNVSSSLDGPKNLNYVDSKFACYAELKEANGNVKEKLSTIIPSELHVKGTAEIIEKTKVP
jgi:hypothetical protein